MQTKTIAGIQCDKRKEKNLFVPQNIEYVISEDDIVAKAVAIGVQFDKSILIKWPKGTGKTSVASYIAQELNRPLSYMQMTWTTSVDEFVGCYLIKDGATYWMDWILATAMKNWHILVLDEANMPTGEITAILHSVMDDRKILVQGTKDEKDWNIIKAHKDFRIIATINPADEGSYTWTKEMNESLIDRFKMVVEATYPNIEKEVKILESKKAITFTDENLTYVNWEEIKTENWVLIRMCMLAEEVRNSDIDYVLSTRNLIDWAELSVHLPIMEAYQYTFENKMDIDSKKEVTSLVLKYFSKYETISKN